MEENVNFDDLFEHIHYAFPRLFEIYLNFKSKKKEVQKTLLNPVCSYYKSKKDIFKIEQKVFLSILILSFFKNIEGYQLNQEDENLKNECKKNLLEFQNKEKNPELKDIDKFSTEEIILYFIKELLKYPIHQIDFLTPEKKWNENGLHLENFKITDEIRNGLINFLGKNENVENYFKEIELKKLLSSKETKVLNTIYEFIKFKSIIKRKRKKLKDGGDKERLNDDYGRNNITKDDCSNKTERRSNLTEEEKRTIRRMLKGLRIKITLATFLGNNLFEYYAKDYNSRTGFSSCDLIDNFDDSENKDEIIIYKKYLDFINIITEYIRKYKDHITNKTDIILELEPISKGQREEILHEESYRRDQIKDIPEVRCISSFDEWINNEKKTHYYIDDNVLIYGINGKLQGFIFMINELCNADYEDSTKM